MLYLSVTTLAGDFRLRPRKRANVARCLSVVFFFSPYEPLISLSHVLWGVLGNDKYLLLGSKISCLVFLRCVGVFHATFYVFFNSGRIARGVFEPLCPATVDEKTLLQRSRRLSFEAMISS